jgi:hypothetical protein
MRRVATVLAVLCLLAAGGVWVRSYYVADAAIAAGKRNYIVINIYNGGLLIRRGYAHKDIPQVERFGYQQVRGEEAAKSMSFTQSSFPVAFYRRRERELSGLLWVLRLPLWLGMAPQALWLLWQRWRRRRPHGRRGFVPTLRVEAAGRGP